MDGLEKTQVNEVAGNENQGGFNTSTVCPHTTKFMCEKYLEHLSVASLHIMLQK